MNRLKTFTISIDSYVQGIGGVTARDREALRAKWESQGFDQSDSSDSDDSSLEDPLDAILDGLAGKNFGAGVYGMSKPAPKVDSYGQPTGITPRLCRVRIPHILSSPSNIPITHRNLQKWRTNVFKIFNKGSRMVWRINVELVQQM
jgi:hypothetical protein